MTVGRVGHLLTDILPRVSFQMDAEVNSVELGLSGGARIHLGGARIYLGELCTLDGEICLAFLRGALHTWDELGTHETSSDLLGRALHTLWGAFLCTLGRSSPHLGGARYTWEELGLDIFWPFIYIYIWVFLNRPIILFFSPHCENTLSSSQQFSKKKNF